MASLLLLGWAAVEAFEMRPLPLAEGGEERTDIPLATRWEARDASEVLIAANPFRPERRPPEPPFSVTSPGVSGADGSMPSPPAGPRPVIVGTARVGPRGFVVASFPGVEARVVRVGETIGGWTLRRVEGNTARFVTESGEMIDLMAEPAL